MSKLFILAVVAIGLGIFGGVIEIQWHPERLGALPGNLIGLAQNGSLLEQARATATTLKRTGEFWLLRDEHQRLEIATNYISVDASRLSKLLEDKADPATILPQAELLKASIERAADTAGESSVDIVAALQGETKQAFSEAASAVKKLAETHENYKELEQKFAEVTDKLKAQIGSVAGVKDEPVPQSETRSDDQPNAEPTIPAIQLNF